MMNNKNFKNTTYDEPILEHAATIFVPMATSAVQINRPDIRQDRMETSANSQDKTQKRKRVYLHSIGRFTNLRKLQMGTCDE